MRHLLLRNSIGTAVLLYVFTFSAVCQSHQGNNREQTKPKEKAEITELPIPVDLMEASTAQFPTASPSRVEVGAKCDSEGNIYAVWSDSAPSTVSEPVRKLLVKSKEIVTFRTPPLDGYNKQLRWAFNIGPDGSLFILVRAQREERPTASSSPTYFIEKFKEDGSFDSRVQLEGPSGEHFQPHNFAVFPDGRFIVLGMAGSVKSGNWRPFAGIFSADGTFAAQVEFARASDVKFPGMTSESDGGTDAAASSFLTVDLSSMTSDPDGNVYIGLGGSPTHVIVVSPSGQVEKEINLKSPAAGLTSAESGVAESGFMYVHFSRINGAPPTVPAGMIGVFNVNTG